MPENSEILLHSHPGDEEDDSLPSPRDFLNCSTTAKNFVVSKIGIIQYWRVDNKSSRQQIIHAVRSRRIQKATRQEYLKFLGEIEARLVIYPWEELDEEKLAKLFRT